MPPLRRYYRGANLVAVRESPSGSPAATRYYHFDTQGTTQCLTDATGAVTDRFASDAWGVQVKKTGSSINRQWYIGARGYSTESPNLSYVRARWVNANLASWLARDPAVPCPSYRYVAGRPTALTDPSGLWVCEAGRVTRNRYLSHQIDPTVLRAGRFSFAAYTEFSAYADITCRREKSDKPCPCADLIPIIKREFTFCQAYQGLVASRLALEGQHNYINLTTWCPDNKDNNPWEKKRDVNNQTCIKTTWRYGGQIRYYALAPKKIQENCKLRVCMADLAGFGYRRGTRIRPDTKCSTNATTQPPKPTIQAIPLENAALPFWWHLVFATWLCHANTGKAATADQHALVWGAKWRLYEDAGNVKLAPFDLGPESTLKVDWL
jgi:RHS repeat-associated protein